MPPSPPVTDHVAEKQARFHADIVQQVADAITSNDIVVVGMTVNPHVAKARKALDQAGLDYTYLGFGGYGSMWKQRLALKIWAGWPTFPQVYVRGTLIGGADDTQRMLESGELQQLLEGQGALSA